MDAVHVGIIDLHVFVHALHFCAAIIDTRAMSVSLENLKSRRLNQLIYLVDEGQRVNGSPGLRQL